MNVSTVSTSTTTHTTVNNKTYKIEMIDDGLMNDQSDDDDDEPPSSPGSTYDDGKDLLHMAMKDEITSQLAAAGPVGVAAAAAIASAKKRKRPHSFETNPSIRKRQQNRLLRKLRQIIFEFTGRVGQQAIVLVATPGKPNTSYKVFGAKPLEDVVRNLKSIVMEELETALAQQAPAPPPEDPSLFELPPLIIDGIPTPVEKMTQAQLRAFIPLMLKYSTGRGKPGWGRESTRPPWWPKELPWANVRMDARTEEEKQKISWTHALRKIVINCYRYHGREDLLPTFSDEEEAKVQQMASNSEGTQTTAITTSNNVKKLEFNMVEFSENANNNNVGVLKIHSSINANSSSIGTSSQSTSTSSTLTTAKQIEIQTTQNAAQTIANAQVCLDPMTLSDVDYTQTVLSTIQNADGTVSLIQVDPNNPIITLPDGTTAQVQGVATLHTTAQGETGATIQTVQGLAEANGHAENMTVDLTEATLAQDGQLIITGEDGQGYPVSVSNMITVPVSASMYQTMVANIQQLHPNGDGTVCITPMQVDQNNPNSYQQSCYQNAMSATNLSSHSSTNASTPLHSATTIALANVPIGTSITSIGANNMNSGRIIRAIFQHPNSPIRQISSSQASGQNKNILINLNNNNTNSVNQNSHNNIGTSDNSNLRSSCSLSLSNSIPSSWPIKVSKKRRHTLVGTKRNNIKNINNNNNGAGRRRCCNTSLPVITSVRTLAPKKIQNEFKLIKSEDQNDCKIEIPSSGVPQSPSDLINKSVKLEAKALSKE